MSRWIAGLLAASAMACTHLDDEARLTDALSPAASLVEGPVLSAGGRFEFHADPWINLHHFMYHAVRAQSEARLRGRVRLSPDDAEVVEAEWGGLPAEIVNAYTPYLEADLVFDETLIAVGAELAAGGPDALSDRVLAAALESVMPVYRETLWPHHVALAQGLLDEQTPLLVEHEEAMAQALEAAFESTWPSGPVRTDLSAYANWAGAYTVLQPNRITLSVREDALPPMTRMELLFHEAGHTEPLGDRLRPLTAQALDSHAFRAGRFWHNLLFYMVAYETERVLDDPAYTPYVHASGLTESRPVAMQIRAAERGWREGDTLQTRVEAAVAALVEAVRGPSDGETEER